MSDGLPPGMVIAVDGPSGVGKSTVCREVARRLGLSYFDTGSTYRIAALFCLREGVALGQAEDVAAAAAGMNANIRLDPDDPRVFLDGDDVTREIRSDYVTAAVSEVATNLEARAILGAFQRDIIAAEVVGGRSRGAGIVVEGRDITTVIAADAPVRVLMTADAEVRVARRSGETEPGSLDAVREAVLGRDAKDSAVVNVHVAADGVITLDTTHLTIDEAAEAIIGFAREATA